MAGWRDRIDRTTNWAITVVAAMLSLSLSTSNAHHGVLIFAMLLILLLLWIEARRYRFFDVYRARVRQFERHYFAQIFSPQPDHAANWLAILGESLRTPDFCISYRVAFARRLRRNYIHMYLILLLAWVLKISTPEPAGRGDRKRRTGPFRRRGRENAALGPAARLADRIGRRRLLRGACSSIAFGLGRARRRTRGWRRACLTVELQVSGQTSISAGTATTMTSNDSGRPKPRIVGKTVAARTHDQRVALVADRSEEVAARADRHRHQEGLRPVAERRGEAGRDRRHDEHGRRVVEEGRDRHGGDEDERQRAVARQARCRDRRARRR